MINIAEREFKIDIKKKIRIHTIQEYTGKKEKTIIFTCRLFGIVRQVNYRSKMRIQTNDSRTTNAIELVEKIRRLLPRLGTRKLYHELFEQLTP